MISAVNQDLVPLRVKVSRPGNEPGFIVFAFQHSVSAPHDSRLPVLVKVAFADRLPVLIHLPDDVRIAVPLVHQLPVRAVVLDYRAVQVGQILPSVIAEGNRPDIGVSSAGRQHQLTFSVIVSDRDPSAGAVVFHFLRGVPGFRDGRRHPVGGKIRLPGHLPGHVVIGPRHDGIARFHCQAFSVQEESDPDCLSVFVVFIVQLVISRFTGNRVPVGAVILLRKGIPILIVGIVRPDVCVSLCHGLPFRVKPGFAQRMPAVQPHPVDPVVFSRVQNRLILQPEV